MMADQIDRSIEQMSAAIARLRVLNRSEAQFACALASMFDEREMPEHGKDGVPSCRTSVLKLPVRRWPLCGLRTLLSA